MFEGFWKNAPLYQLQTKSVVKTTADFVASAREPVVVFTFFSLILS